MKVVSLFAGIGGIDFAFESQSHTVIWANEYDNFAIETYKLNFPETLIDSRDIRNIPLNDIPNMDILTAGFPCQSFSVMGKQEGFNDPRGNLFFEIIRIVKEKQPKIIFLENVRNLQYHDDGRTFATINNLLSDCGYYIKYKVMSPHEYVNISQERQRIFIVAFKNKLEYECFSFPNEVSLTTKINNFIDREKLMHESFYYDCTNKYAQKLEKRVTDTECIYRIDDSGIATKKWLICPTLKANMGTYPDRVPVIRDKYGIRKLTLRECLNFQGFPSDFKFPPIPLNEAYKQIGNSVCVELVKSIVKKINV